VTSSSICDVASSVLWDFSVLNFLLTLISGAVAQDGIGLKWIRHFIHGSTFYSLISSFYDTLWIDSGLKLQGAVLRIPIRSVSDRFSRSKNLTPGSGPDCFCPYHLSLKYAKHSNFM
jgi:hypothetical protein